MTEAELRSAVIALAEQHGWRVYAIPDSRRVLGSTGAGYPDLTLVRPGMILFAELKTRTGKTSPEQDRWLELLRSTFTSVHIWRPKDWIEGTIERVLSSVRVIGDDSPPPDLIA